MTAHVTNVEVLRKMKKDREVINTVKIRKLQSLGHLMRNGQGKVLGKRGVGRPRISRTEKFKVLVWHEYN